MTRDEMIEQAVELASAAVHEKWMATKRGQGVSSRCSESGEELMVPYDQLSEAAKDLDRGSVRATVRALADAGLLADPEQCRPVVLLRADDCDCGPPYADCPHGPEPVDARSARGSRSCTSPTWTW
jgi:DNA-binding transcriptional ArsR family regulator